jgi:hypothetical protein
MPGTTGTTWATGAIWATRTKAAPAAVEEAPKRTNRLKLYVSSPHIPSDHF